MKIKVERSGGFAGIPLFNEMDEKDMPSSFVHTVKKIIDATKVSPGAVKSHQKGAADKYTYKISVQDGTSLRVIECNEDDIRDDLKSLVKYIERNSKQKN